MDEILILLSAISLSILLFFIAIALTLSSNHTIEAGIILMSGCVGYPLLTILTLKKIK